MRYLPAHAQHIGARHYQQDSLGLADPEDQAFLSHGGYLAVLCDGMGGMEHGDIASQTAVRATLDAYARKTSQESIPAALERSAREANEGVIEAALNLGLKEGVGTTLVAAVLHSGFLYFISVGDSAVFHVRDGVLHMVNRPHVFANLLDQAADRGQISRSEAAQHPERESLTSFIGIHNLEEIDHNLEPWPFSDGDTILLASDGMFKTLDPEEIQACLTGHPQSWPQILVDRTLAKGNPGQDNVTVVSITSDSGKLGTWDPQSPDSIFHMPPETVPASKSSSQKAWLLAAGLLLLVAVAFGGLWYFSAR
ncbi:MAG: protein phosphatase 2C domain-containing protein [Acidobacteriota bacterium]|nr:protein phosphatase 2C domain-containing protein [Acidobacteriota bacterium]